MHLTLRNYQNEALAALDAGSARGLTRQAVVLPTGSGKTVVFAELARRAHARGERPLILVHRDELAKQTLDKLHSVMPDASIGMVKAQHNDVDADVIVGSVQTLARERRRDQVHNVGMLVVDEAHHAVAPSYMQTLIHFGSFAKDDRGTPTSGWTATLARGDAKGLGTVWEEVVYERDILWMIERGHLVDVKGKAVTIDGLNLGQVARTRGDYQEGDLGRALESVGAGEHVANAYLEHAKDRQGVLFAPTVATAQSMAVDLNRAGITTETVFGFTDLETRADVYERFRTGETQVLANAMVLTEGWDAPWAECAVIARPTNSTGLYIQMVGRVLRPWPGKHDALVLDVVGASRHKLATLKDLSRWEPGEGETLLQAREREERELGQKGRASGVQTAADVDLFARSRSAWLQTRAGLWFVPTRQHVVFLWPKGNGLFKVGTMSSRGGEPARMLADDVTLDYGMAWAEQAAAEVDPSVSTRTASWRTRRQPPSQQQVELVRRLGLTVPQDATKASVSDVLSIHFASRLLDSFTRRN